MTPSSLIMIGIAAFLGTLAALAFWAWLDVRKRAVTPEEYPVMRRPDELP